MAHFVKLDANNMVVDCIVVANADAPDPAPENSEPAGQAFIVRLAQGDPRLEGNWIQTSYSASFRTKYAAIGDFYNPVTDEFVPPPPKDES